MDNREVMNRVGAIIEAHGTGLLATIDDNGHPHVRWMTPTLLRASPGVIYALTAPGFSTFDQVRAHAQVEWMFQTPTLDEVITIRGLVNVVDNPSLRSEVLEALGTRLNALWKLAPQIPDLVVLETVVEKAVRYLPMQGHQDIVRF
jgi:pyridoxamine 5'-phosphate oxidase